MALFKVDITETYKRTITVEAADCDKAYEIVDNKITEGEINLPCDGGDYSYERYLYTGKMD